MRPGVATYNGSALQPSSAEAGAQRVCIPLSHCRSRIASIVPCLSDDDEVCAIAGRAPRVADIMPVGSISSSPDAVCLCGDTNPWMIACMTIRRVTFRRGR